MAPILRIFMFAVMISATVGASPARIYGVVNGTITLPCSLNGTRGSHVYWYTDDYLSFDRTIQRTVSGDIAPRLAVTGVGLNYDLVISPLRINDSRIYSCHIYHTVNGSKQYLSTVDYEVVVRSPPGMHYPECEYQISGLRSVGEVAIMSCVSRGGIPPAQLSWYRGDQLLSSQKHSSENIVTFSKTLTEYDNGVEFTCRGISPVVAEPRQCSVSPLRILPSVNLNASQTRVLENNDVTYSCSGDGMPSVSYRWYANDVAITQNSARYVLYDGGRGLHLMSASMSDNGTVVTCQVVTPSGLASTGRRMLFVSKRTESCSSSNNTNAGGESLIQNAPQMLLIIVAFLGGVGFTLLVMFVITLAWRRRRRRRDLRAKHNTELWSNRRIEYSSAAEPATNHDIFTKDSVFVTSSSVGHQPSHPPLGQPMNQVQKNQYFEMNSGTFCDSAATLPTKAPRSDHQLISTPNDHHHLLHHHHHHGIGYENVGRGSGTDLTDISQSETSEHFRQGIPSANGQQPLSPIYMDPRMPSVPIPLSSEAVVNGTARGAEHVDSARRGVRVLKGPSDQPEYTEIDHLGHSPPVCNTYEASIISRFDL